MSLQIRLLSWLSLWLAALHWCVSWQPERILFKKILFFLRLNIVFVLKPKHYCGTKQQEQIYEILVETASLLLGISLAMAKELIEHSLEHEVFFLGGDLNVNSISRIWLNSDKIFFQYLKKFYKSDTYKIAINLKLDNLSIGLSWQSDQVIFER